ncbi:MULTISPECIES: hypothetical protein [Burkholderia]|nr:MULTISPECIES: hypothetical protein [Burkholderia]NIE85238.1 hypothetical protein [Burkholderia sp. Tr-860]NIF65105.1 hypothetical protein [Burkholderia sp. Cy-647]NIF98589.1 hypothetical protein [Burkholderia sp. Ax-1720]
MDESSKSGLAGPAAARIGAAASAKSVVRENPARPEGTTPARLHGKPSPRMGITITDKNANENHLHKL